MKKLVIMLIAVALIFAVYLLGVSSCLSCIGSNPDTAPAQTTEPTTVDNGTPPKTVSVNTKTLALGVGEAYTLTALYDFSSPANGVKFSSDNTSVLTADETSGLLTAKSEGYATVTAESFNKITAKCYVTVKKALTQITFRSAKTAMQTGEQAQLSVKPVSDKEGLSGAAFSSDNSSVAEVTQDGALTAKSEGTATITATAFNGKTAVTKVTVYNNSEFTEKNTEAGTTLQSDAGWDSETLAEVPAYSKVKQYGESDDGRWIKVEYEDKYGWIYNKALGAGKNYSEMNLDTLPIMLDDLIFDLGRDKRALFDYVYTISYENSEDDTDENLCVYYFQRGKGSCYHHAAMLCLLYNRCGWQSVRVVGTSPYDGVSKHSWILCKTEDGWRHVDAQYFTIRDADSQYFLTDEQYVFFTWDKESFPAAIDESAVSEDTTKAEAEATTAAVTESEGNGGIEDYYGDEYDGYEYYEDNG